MKLINRILSPLCKIDTVEKIDRFISAEFLDPDREPILYNIV